MNLVESDELRLLRDSALKFIECEHDPVRGRAAGFSRDVWRQFAELGWLALPFAEEQGGLGGGAREVGALNETFGRALINAPYVAHVVLGAGVLAAGASSRFADTLSQTFEGKTLIALAHLERAEEPWPVVPSTTAHRTAGGWRLSGSKRMVLGGGDADYFLISANLEGHAADVGLFLAPRKHPGVIPTLYELIDGSIVSDLSLSDATLSDGQMVCDGPVASRALQSGFDAALLVACATAVGAMRHLIETTTEYMKTRVQFGGPIADKQVIRHRLADMLIACEEASSITLAGQLSASSGDLERGRTASAAKVKVGQAARFVAEQAVQLHGAMGVTDELEVGAYFKRLLAFQLSFGANDFHLRRHRALGVQKGRQS
ncbi:acyl-CoA dehydrogenase [Brevundimonas sp.]|uniref:acyl-CoA dehydrogenase family protein n=1 Tax=Brevundimonas sp. TaxID=1871086 RepID=UPI0028978190|nr:acyl-CoA dehydrogenase [Brevundimonas sp.]